MYENIYITPMSVVQYKKYFWLVDTIRSAGKITKEQIDRKWSLLPMTGLPLSTIRSLSQPFIRPSNETLWTSFSRRSNPSSTFFRHVCTNACRFVSKKLWMKGESCLFRCAMRMFACMERISLISPTVTSYPSPPKPYLLQSPKEAIPKNSITPANYPSRY